MIRLKTYFLPWLATAVPPELSLTIEEMGRVCVAIIEKVTQVIKNKDTDRALEVEKDDDAIDALHRKIIQTFSQCVSNFKKS